MKDIIDSVSESSYYLYCICIDIKHCVFCLVNISNQKNIWLAVKFQVKCIVKSSSKKVEFPCIIWIPDCISMFEVIFTDKFYPALTRTENRRIFRNP